MADSSPGAVTQSNDGAGVTSMDVELALSRYRESLLTVSERNLIEDLGDIYLAFESISVSSPRQEIDLTIVDSHIAALQNWVLAQAAARAWPQEYRLIGESRHNRERT